MKIEGLDGIADFFREKGKVILIFIVLAVLYSIYLIITKANRGGGLLG